MAIIFYTIVIEPYFFLIQFYFPSKFFLDLLQGYAGISVALGFYGLAVSQLSEEQDLGDLVSTIIFLFPLPIFIMIAAIPSIILLDIIKKQRITYMRTLAKAYGIKDYLESIWETKNIE